MISVDLREIATTLDGDWMSEENIEAAVDALHSAADKIDQLNATIADLHNGKRAILPQTKKHAEDLYVVAVASLKTFNGVSPEDAIRSATIEECAKVAEDLARKRRESESSRGFTSETATQVANTYWCEEIAESIRSLTKAGKGE